MHHYGARLKTIDQGAPLSTLQIGYIVASGDAPMTGSERYYFDLLRELAALGVPSTGLVVGDPPAAFEGSVESFAPEHGIGGFARIRRLREAVRRGVAKADLIAAHSPEHAWAALDIVRRKPLVIHFHGPRALEYRAEGRGKARIAIADVEERLTYARAARFIVLSEANARTLRDHYHVPNDRICIVPGAVDLERFTPTLTKSEARAWLGWQQNRPIAVAVRRLAATKGIENLIDAVVLLKERISDVLVALVGTGPLQSALQARVAALGLSEHVTFAGQLNETLPAAYRAADVSIVPSIGLEGFGLSVVESLACGTPALVTPITGLPEVVRALDERLILAGTAPAEIADGLAGALGDPTTLPSQEACLAYVQRFAWPSIATRIVDIYADAVREQRGRRSSG